MSHLVLLHRQDAFLLQNDVYPLGLPLPDQFRGWTHTPDMTQHTKHQVSASNIRDKISQCVLTFSYKNFLKVHFTGDLSARVASRTFCVLSLQRQRSERQDRKQENHRFAV